MSPNAPRTTRLAVLIDAENISAKYVAPLLAEIAKLGTATAKRIYGDWTQPQHARWRDLLNLHALIPIQQFQLSAGKNSTDCALIIDAMDLLYSGNFEGFCLVSSDGDFTRLACRIRESGLSVYGFGESKTPASFVKSCDRFVALEILAAPADARNRQASLPGSTSVEGGATAVSEGEVESRGDHTSPFTTARASRPAPVSQQPTRNNLSTFAKGGARAADTSKGPTSPPGMKRNEGLQDLVKTAYLSVADEDGWAFLGAFGAQMRKLSPSFDPRGFGCGKLGDFIAALDLFEVKKVPSPRNPLSNAWYIRAK